jgi:hypothetical protein
VLFVLRWVSFTPAPFVRARNLFTQTADIASGRVLIRALSELASVCYLFDDSAGMTAAVERANRAASSADPEQAMLAAYFTGAAHVFDGAPIWADLWSPTISTRPSRPSIGPSGFSCGWVTGPRQVGRG